MSDPRFISVESLPSHWRATRAKFLFPERDERGFEDEAVLSASQKYGMVPQADLEQRTTIALKGLDNFKLVCPGDFVISLRSFQGGIEHSELRGIASPAYTVMAPEYPRLTAYYRHYLKSSEFIARINAVASGIRDGKTIRYDDFGDVEIPVPPEGDGAAIAAFLDHETAKIDRLIDKQQRLIELLAEKRQAVISHAVTDYPSATLGKLAYYIDLLPGYAFPSSGFTTDPSDVRLLRGANVGVDGVRWDDVVYWPKADIERLDRYWLRPGDLVFGMDRPWISAGTRIATVTKADVPALLLQRVARLRVKPGLTQHYLKLILMSKRFKDSIEVDLTGVSVPHISPDQIASFRIALPPEREQQAISRKVYKQLAVMEETTVKARNSIELLSEHRTALISAAVTGKIDVRNWRPDAEQGSVPELSEAADV